MQNSDKPTVCVIGSGPGGCIAAIELAKSGHAKVVVVDVDRIGEPYAQRAEAKLEDTQVGSPSNQEITRAFGFGGSSNLWHGVFSKMDEEDWSFLDAAAGHCVSDEIKVLYYQLGQTFGEVPTERRFRMVGHSPGNELYREIESSGEFASKDFFIQKQPMRTRSLLAHAKRMASDISFVNEATALYLIGSNDDPAKAAALAIDVSGQRQIVAADYFILSAGALETPRIVLQGNQDGHFFVSNANVGKCLFDHPWTVIGEIVSKRGLFRLGLSDVFATTRVRYRIGYRLRNSIDNPRLGGNHCIAFKPLFFGNYALFKEAMKSIIALKPSFRSISQLFGRFGVLNIFASLFMLASEKFGLGAWVRKSLVFCYLEQPLREEACVSLTKTVASNGRRIPAIRWIVGNEESESISHIQKTLSGVLAESTRFDFVPYANADRSLASGAHHAGTMRIGKDKSNGVIDKNLKIFGTSNVFVCDSSIFPNFGNSNPTLTVSAFSLRLARHILSRLSRNGNE